MSPVACARRLPLLGAAGLLLALTVAPAAAPGAPRDAPAPRASREVEKVLLEDVVRAAADPSTDRLAQLLRAGAPADGYALRRRTPLQAAAEAGRSANAFLLIEKGARIDRVAARGRTALGWAAAAGHEHVVRLLLDAGASPDAAADASRAPVVLAVERGHETVVSLLLARGSHVFDDADLAGAVLLALGETSVESLSALLVPRLAPAVAQSESMRAAAALAMLGSSKSVAESVRRHLGATAETRQFQTTLLLLAARRHRPDVVAAAIARGADVNAHDPRYGSPLGAAVVARDADVVSLLAAAGADWLSSGVDREEFEALTGSHLTDSRLADLIASIGSPNLRDEHGETPLFRAARGGDVGTVALLLQRGLDPAATVRRWPGDRGWTPLMIAAAGGHATVVDQLLAAGAPVDERNDSGRTALAFAAFYGRGAAARALLAAGADPDARDTEGLTPRVLAKHAGDPDTAGLLADAPERSR